MLLNSQWITEEIKEEIKKYPEINEHETTMIQILQDPAKAVLRGKLIAIKSYLRKQEKSQTNNLTSKTRERTSKTYYFFSLQKKIIKIRAEINEIERKKIIAKYQ